MKKLFEHYRADFLRLRNHIGSLAVSAALFTFFCTDVISDFSRDSEIEFAVYMALGILFAGFLLTEFLIGGKKKWIGYVLSAAVAVTLGVLLKVYHPMDWEQSVSYEQNRVLAASVGTGVIFAALALHSAWRKSGKIFQQYTARLFEDVVVLSIISGIIESLLLFIAGIITALFGDFPTKMLMIGSMFVSCFLFIPGLIVALFGSERENSRAFRFVIRFILPVFEITAIVIGYIYAIKIAVEGKMPSNSVFTVVTALFCVCFTVWMVDDVDTEPTVYTKIRKWIPAAFSPLIFLQGLALYLRIHQYGFTAARTFGCALVVFEVFVVLLWIIRRKKLSLVLPVLAGLAFILTIPPVTNVYAIERWSADQTWAGNHQKEDDEDYWERESNYSWISLYQSHLAPVIDVSGYTEMQQFALDRNALPSYDVENGYDIDFHAVPVVFTGTEETAVLDLADFVEAGLNYREAHDSFTDEEEKEYLRGLNPVVSDGEMSAWIDSIEIGIECTEDEDGEVKKVISDFDVEGYILR